MCRIRSKLVNLRKERQTVKVLQRLSTDELEKPASVMEHISDRKAKEFWIHCDMSTLGLTKRTVSLVSQNHIQFIGRTWRKYVATRLVYAARSFFLHINPVAVCLLFRTQSQRFWRKVAPLGVHPCLTQPAAPHSDF